MDDIQDKDIQLNLPFNDFNLGSSKQIKRNKRAISSNINVPEISGSLHIKEVISAANFDGFQEASDPDLNDRLIAIESKIEWIKEWCIQKDKKDLEERKWIDLAPLNQSLKEEPLLISLKLPRIQDWPILYPVKKRHSQFGDIAMLYIILLQRPCSTWDFFYAGETGEVLNRFFNHDAINALDSYGMSSYEVRYQLLKNFEYKGTNLNAQANRKQLEKALCSKLAPTWDFWPPNYRMKFKKKELPMNEVWEYVTLRS